jgi:hypothetical protein
VTTACHARARRSFGSQTVGVLGGFAVSDRLNGGGLQIAEEPSLLVEAV